MAAENDNFKVDSPSKIAVFGDDSKDEFRLTHRSSIKI
jgi:hypothetical protein